MNKNNNLDLVLKYVNSIGAKNLNDKTVKRKNIKSQINSINKEYYLNEEQKRVHRSKILKSVTHLIFFQLIFFNIIVAIMLSSIIFKFKVFKDLDIKTIELILNFLKYYISATIVELLGMLFFIVRNVFDSSLKDLGGIKNKVKKEEQEDE